MKNLISIRKANYSDEAEILNWRNSQQSIRNSLGQKKINKSEHKEWFLRAIKSDNDHHYIALLKNKKIGIVSFHLNKNKNFFVSINLNPKYRNKRLGSKVLLLTQKKREIREKNNLIFARIKSNNIASLKTFNKANFKLFRKYQNYLLFSYESDFHILRELTIHHLSEERL